MTLTLTAYTYHYDAFYPLCSGSSTLTLTPQTITPFIDTSQCDSSTVAASNSVNLSMAAYSATAGDVVLITGMSGTVTDVATWSSTTINGTSYFTHTLTAS